VFQRCLLASGGFTSDMSANFSQIVSTIHESVLSMEGPPGYQGNSTDKDFQSENLEISDHQLDINTTAPQDTMEHSAVMALGGIFLVCWIPGYLYDLFDTYGNYDSHPWNMLSIWLVYLCAILNPMALHLPHMIRIIAPYWHSCRNRKNAA
jgi:hypothetical protein